MRMGSLRGPLRHKHFRAVGCRRQRPDRVGPVVGQDFLSWPLYQPPLRLPAIPRRRRHRTKPQGSGTACRQPASPLCLTDVAFRLGARSVLRAVGANWCRKRFTAVEMSFAETHRYGEATAKRRHSPGTPLSRALRAPRTRALTRSRGRAACWTRARRSALPMRLRVPRCARRSRRCHRRGPRTRRCATRPAPRCRVSVHRVPDRRLAQRSIVCNVDHLV